MRKEEIENRRAIGRRYGSWEVIGIEKGKKGTEWVCRCICGEIRRQKIDNVRSGRSRMCKKCSGRLRRREGSRKWKSYLEE